MCVCLCKCSCSVNLVLLHVCQRTDDDDGDAFQTSVKEKSAVNVWRLVLLDREEKRTTKDISVGHGAVTSDLPVPSLYKH